MTWQIALFLNIIFGTVRAFTDKKLVEKLNPFLAFFYGVLYEGAFLILYCLWQLHTLPAIYPEMMLLGALYGIGIGVYYEAIKINLAQSTIFSSYYLLISILLAAVLLGEWQLINPATGAGMRTLMGLTIAFISMWLIVHEASKREEKIEKRWVVFIVINILVNGVGAFWVKMFLANHNSFESLFSQIIGGFAMLFIINLLKKNRFRISFENHKLAALDGLMMVLAVTFYFMMIQKGPLTLVLPIQTLAITIAIVIGGLFLFKEVHNLNRQKITGMALGFIGVLLLMIQ